jgi:cytochrome c2
MRNLVSEEIEAGRALIARSNCRGCHEIEGAGGDIRSTIESSAFWPPLLDTQGAKTQPQWLHGFLSEPGEVTLRNWLETRMPTFGFTPEEAGTLTAYFSAIDGVDYPFIDTSIATTDALLDTGEELFGEMDCTLCHPTANQTPNRPPEELAPTLDLAWERLRPAWVMDWIFDPQAIMPGTGMPQFFPGGETQYPEYLDGSVEDQIRAIRDHLFLNVGEAERRTGTSD